MQFQRKTNLRELNFNGDINCIFIITYSCFTDCFNCSFIEKRGKNIEDNFDKEEFVKSIKKQQKTNITVLTLPIEIENLSNNQVRDISRKILRIFESLEYKKNAVEYAKFSWHSWQVSILMSLYKREIELFIPNKSDVFRDDIVEQSESSLKELMSKLVSKYKKEVKIQLNKEILSKNRIWSGEEVAIILCFLSRYKEFK